MMGWAYNIWDEEEMHKEVEWRTLWTAASCMAKKEV
jgi:hypothetical protein